MVRLHLGEAALGWLLIQGSALLTVSPLLAPSLTYSFHPGIIFQTAQSPARQTI